MLFLRDQTMYAAIFGLFSFVWFGWAQEKPRPSWRKWLGLGAFLGAILTIVGGILSYLNWQSPSILRENQSKDWYLFFFVIEFGLGFIGALFLVLTKRSSHVAPWISWIVGLHFIALKFVFQDVSLFLLAGWMLLVGFAAYPLSRHFNVAKSAMTGAGNGIALLLFALVHLVLAFGLMR